MFLFFYALAYGSVNRLRAKSCHALLPGDAASAYLFSAGNFIPAHLLITVQLQFSAALKQPAGPEVLR